MPCSLTGTTILQLPCATALKNESLRSQTITQAGVRRHMDCKVQILSLKGLSNRSVL